MKLLLWASERRIALLAAHRTRRAFRRHRLSPAAQRRLAEAMRRRTP
jgi:hypothetical protein